MVFIKGQTSVWAVRIFKEYILTWYLWRILIGLRSPLLTLFLRNDCSYLSAFILGFRFWVGAVDVLKFVRKSLLEVFEGQHNNCNVIKCFVWNRCFHDLFNNITTNLMNWLFFCVKVLFCSDPRLLYHLSIANFVKYSITPKQKEIHFVINNKFFDFRSCNYNIWISSKLFPFGFDISKRPWDWQSSGKHSKWAINDIWVVFSFISLLHNCCVILSWLICDSLNLFHSITSCDGLSLINSSTIGQYSFLFRIIIGFVIKR